MTFIFFFFFQAEDGIRDYKVTGVQTCALPISLHVVQRPALGRHPGRGAACRARLGAGRLPVVLPPRGRRHRAAARRLPVRPLRVAPRDAAVALGRAGGRPRHPGGVADGSAGHGAGESMKIAVLFDTQHPDWSDADYKKAIETKVEEAEYDVGRALVAKGHDVLMVGVHEALPPLLDRLAGFQPKLVFNGCEAFRGRAHHEYGLAAVLEMHGYRYTGSSPIGLLVARNKSLTKKILAYHGIRVPAFDE